MSCKIIIKGNQKNPIYAGLFLLKIYTVWRQDFPEAFSFSPDYLQLTQSE